MNPEFLPAVVPGESVDLSGYLGGSLVAANSEFQWFLLSKATFAVQIDTLTSSPNFISSASCAQEDGKLATFIIVSNKG